MEQPLSSPKHLEKFDIVNCSVSVLRCNAILDYSAYTVHRTNDDVNRTNAYTVHRTNDDIHRQMLILYTGQSKCSRDTHFKIEISP